MVILKGTNNGEQLVGGAGSDSINGFGGNDLIYGLGAGDLLIGGADSDHVFGGAGNDDLYGEAGVDFLYGDADSDRLEGGYGEDRLEGGDGDDFLFGGEDGSADTLIGGAGIDWFYSVRSRNDIDGGEGNDSFYLSNVNGMAGVRIEGGLGHDILYLNVALEDLVIETYLGSTWESTLITLYAPGMAEAIQLRSVEQVVTTQVHFDLDARTVEKEPPIAIANTVRPIDRDLNPSYEGAIVAEMARLASLAYEDPASLPPSGNWRAFDAIALGLQASNFTTGIGRYTFENGVYSVRTGGLLGFEAIGNALVLFGELNGEPTIVIAFRGTDEKPSDFGTYDFTANYAQFLPLVNAVKQFAAENGVDQIFLTGHSMGAALAQTALGESFATSDGWDEVRAYLFASPGGDEDQAPDVPADRIMTFNRRADDIPLAADTIFKETVGPIIDMVTANVRPEIPLLALNHGREVYAEDLEDLSRVAADPYSPGFYNTDFAASVREGRQWQGGSLAVAVGNAEDNILFATDQIYVVGGSGNDLLLIGEPRARPDRLVDGGGGALDIAVIMQVGPVTRTGGAGDFHLFMSGAPIGHYVGVEAYIANGVLIFSSGRTASIQRPAGATQAVQTAFAAAAAAPATFVVNPDFDAADAGDGALSVVGTATDDIIFAGIGNKTIQGKDGNDILVVRDGGSAAQPDQITLDGGAGLDVMSGGSGSERILVDNAGDVVSGGGGTDTVEASVSYALPEDVENLTLVGGATDGAGNAQANLLLGNPLANSLAGEAGDDVIESAAGNDTADGGDGQDWVKSGDGADNVTGGSGHDSLWGGAGDDLLEGGPGDDTIDGGAGIDTVTYAAAGARVEVELGLLEDQNTRGAGVDTLVSIENLVGSAFGDRLTGNAGANWLTGGGGGDVLAGGAGADRFVYLALSDSTQAAPDLIADFAAGDRIDLSAIDANRS
ncbi:MAG: M10 family metallopeptidase C-terminal domain-containing protein, partial [Allosphingosinicella sp.]